jgi:hypothetical protein
MVCSIYSHFWYSPYADILSSAARHVKNTELRQHAIALLDDIQKRTGFHTRSKIERQLAVKGLTDDDTT